jgi:hypothetical protein
MAQRGLGCHLLHPLAVQVMFVPWPVGQELLQALRTRPRNRLGHGVTVFVGQLGEQPGHIPLQSCGALRSTEAHLEGAQKCFQLRQLRETGMHVHGYPPLAEEDTTPEPVLTK